MTLFYLAINWIECQQQYLLNRNNNSHKSPFVACISRVVILHFCSLFQDKRSVAIFLHSSKKYVSSREQSGMSETDTARSWNIVRSCLIFLGLNEEGVNCLRWSLFGLLMNWSPLPHLIWQADIGRLSCSTSLTLLWPGQGIRCVSHMSIVHATMMGSG